MRVERVVSGGQTGVDRAALDVALSLGVEIGGWCPRGRRAEDGAVPARHPLRETAGRDYPERTRRNVDDADGTLVLTRGRPTGGTALTVRLAAAARKPVIVVDLLAFPDVDAVSSWIERGAIRTLNVAGPRESSAPGIGAEAARYLLRLLG